MGIDCVQNQFGFVIPDCLKFRKRLSSKRSSRKSSIVREEKFDDALLERNDESKSLESIESSTESSDVIRENVGGFEQIFPFNAETCEANTVLTNLTISAIS